MTLSRPNVEKASAKMRFVNMGFGIFFLLLGTAELLMVALKAA